MANFNINVIVNTGGILTLDNPSGTDGENFGSPLVVSGGDTVTFVPQISSGFSASVTNLAIFTNNNTINLSPTSGNVVRTVSSGATATNTITGTSDVFETDFFYLSRSAASITYGGAPPTQRDHGNNKWVVMNGGTIAYATSQSTTTVTARQMSTNSSATILTTVNRPARGEISIGTGRTVSADKPIMWNSTAGGHRMVPLSAKGKEFGDYHLRNGDQTYFFYAEQDTNVAIYDNVTGGITGTSTSSFLLSASTIQTYTRPASNSSTWVFFASDADMVMSKTAGSGFGTADKHILAPAADIMYGRRLQYSRVTDNTLPSNITGGSGNPGAVYDSSNDRVVTMAIGDGAGADSEFGIGDHNISNTYLWPWSLRDFVIVAPNTNKVHVESFESGAWITRATYTFTGTSTSPQNVRRDGDSGFTTVGTNWTGNAAPFNTNTLWRFRGTNNFAVFVNDNSTDEEAIWGYTATVVDVPTDITFGTNNTSASTVALTVTGSGGTGGIIQVSEDNSTWSSNGTSFNFRRGVSKTVYSRRFLASENLISASVYSEALTLSYLDPDTTIDTIPLQVLQQSDTQFDITIANGSSNTIYEVRTGSYTGTIEGSRTGSGTLTVTDAPTSGNQKTYYVTAYRTTASGGDGSTRSNIQTFVASKADITPETYTNLGGDVTSTPTSTTYYATFSTTAVGTTSPGTGLALGTTIDDGTNISVGNGEYRINSGTFTSTGATVDANDTVYFRGTSAGTAGTTTSHSLTIGDTTHSFSTTTAAGAVSGGDYGIQIYSASQNLVLDTSDRTGQVAYQTSVTALGGATYTDTTTTTTNLPTSFDSEGVTADSEIVIITGDERTKAFLQDNGAVSPKWSIKTVRQGTGNATVTVIVVHFGDPV